MRRELRAKGRGGPSRRRLVDGLDAIAPDARDGAVEVGRRRTIASDLPSPIIELSRDGRLRFANNAATALLGLTGVQRGCRLLDALGATAGDHERLRRRLGPLLARRTVSARVWLDGLDGTARPSIWRVARRRDCRDRTLGFVAQAETRPESHRLAERAALLERRLDDSAAAVPAWLWETDAQHRFCYLSQRLEVLTDIAPSRLLGQTRTALMAATLPPDSVARHAAELAAHRPFHDLAYRLRVDGKERRIRVSGRPVFDDDGRFQGYRGVGWEVASAGEAAAGQGIVVRHDPLTGLENRPALGEALAAAIEGLERSGKHVVLLVLDLEAFKRVNESYGHRIGDLLLQQAARRLRGCGAGTDTLARLGGDEFAVVATLPRATGGLGVTIAERIVAPLRQPFGIDGHEIHCGVRVGVAVAPCHGTDVQVLLQHADLALAEAKRRNERVCQYGSELGAALKRRKTIDDALRRALARDEMSLVLQPQLAVRDRRLVGGEALLRWRHGRPDEVGPAVFIPIAEESGLIVELGSWVLAEACRLVAAWRCRDSSLRIAFNLSPMQFCNRDLACEVEQALAAAGLPPEALELEITEGVLMRDTQRAARTLSKLHELGVGIALDDFGTGFSSLSYLKRFPIDRLKIDQAFIRDLEHDADDRHIAKAIVGLGHSLALEVVAEGVETLGQLTFLADLGCDIAQGYLFSRPLSAAAFGAALRSLDGFAPPAAGRLVANAHEGGTVPAQLHA